MKMKRNTKYKANFKNIAIDISVVIISLAIIGLSLFLFFGNLNKTFKRTDKKQVATITFKYKAVQRRFIDSSVWDRPVQSSPIYDGDIIRTSPDAEATIIFTNKNKIKLGANTMVQVFSEKPEETSVNFTTGVVSVQTGVSSKMFVKSNSSNVSLEQGSSLRADKTKADKLKLIVEKGSAGIQKHIDFESTSEDISNYQKILKAGQVNEFIDNADSKDSKFENSEFAEIESITMISPENNLKILNQRQKGEPAEILFRWYHTFKDDDDLVLETSLSKQFDKDVEKKSIKNLNELTVKHISGYLFWRAYSNSKGFNDASAVSGKLLVLSAPPPKSLSPKQGEIYTYKNEYPQINFVWDGNEFTGSYLLEVADNPNMNSPIYSAFSNVNSVTLSEFGENTWYWQITPRYLLDTSLEMEKSPVYSFTVKKTEEISPTKFISPESFGNMDGSKKLNFSWYAVPEAKKYNVKIYQENDLSNPIYEDTSNFNHFEIPNDLKVENGTYYLKVAAISKGGDVLSVTELQKFITRDTEFILRSVFPPNGYTVADSLCFDTRFTWKSNLSEIHTFQISSSKDFSKILFQKNTAGTMVSGIKLEQGSWYWRVVSRVGKEEITTKVNELIVAPPLDKPELIDVGAKIIIVENKKNTIKWKKIVGADYYQVKINLADRKAKQPLYENLFITENEIELDLKDIKDGTYIISVQGFSGATFMSGRRYSLAVDHYVYFKHLKPVELIYPSENGKLSGVMTALKNPVFKWKFSEKPVISNLILEKLDKRQKKWISITNIENPKIIVKIPTLSPGFYRWAVKAMSYDELDISSIFVNFEVLPIEPLDKPEVVLPKNNTVFGVPYFKQHRSIKFKFKKIKDATDYIIELYPKNEKRNILKQDIHNTNKKDTYIEYEFKNISALSGGDFVVEFRAQRRTKDGTVFQDGIIENINFKINLPIGQKVKTHETGVLYGK